MDDQNLRRRLHDLQRLRVNVVLERALRQAQPVGIVQAAFRGAPLIQVRGRPLTSGSTFLIQIPERSGLPSGVRGAGAARFGLPSGPFGMLEV